MGAITIITLILAVPAALIALFSLLEKAKGRQDDNSQSERGAARYAYELTCVYAPRAFLVVSFLSFNYQNANPTIRIPVVGTEANNVVGMENSDAVSDDVIGELPRPVQDRHH